jgi:hypothetical protein
MRKTYWSHKSPNDCPVVVVKWRDIRSSAAWEEDSDEDIRPCRNLYTVGYLLHDGPDPEELSSGIVVIAATYDWDEKTWADFTVFPRTVLKTVSPARGESHAQTH